MKFIPYFFFCLFLLSSISCSAQKNTNTSKNEINLILDNWHKAAAEANFANYFTAMTEESIFIGTDALEHWNKKEFMAYAKPHFDKGKAWSFTSLQRNIYFSKDGKTAWFDELLSTQMKLCRGSGVLTQENGIWKIEQYVLSMTVPNEVAAEVIKNKAPIEDALLDSLMQK